MALRSGARHWGQVRAAAAQASGGHADEGVGLSTRGHADESVSLSLWFEGSAGTPLRTALADGACAS